MALRTTLMVKKQHPIIKTLNLTVAKLDLSYKATYPGCLSCWQQTKQGIQDIPLPSNIFRRFLGDLKALPSQMRYIIPPACSGSTPGSPISLTCPENLQKEVPRRHPDQMDKPSQLSLFDIKGAATVLWASFWMSELLTLFLRLRPSQPMVGNHLGCLCPWSHSFGHYPKLVTIDEGWNVFRLSSLIMVLYNAQPRQSNLASDSKLLTLIPNPFTLGCKPQKCALKVTVWWNQQNHITCKEQRRTSRAINTTHT